MANQWLRLWHDMPTDPKWRTIAKVSGQRIGDVMAVYVHLLVCASNATERGRTQSFSCEDAASALDLETDQVEAILAAMQKRVLDGDRVSAWERRQVNREDGSAERAKAWRESQKANAERTPNAAERKQAPDKEEIREEKEKEKDPPAARVPRASRKCPEQFVVTDAMRQWASTNAPSVDLNRETDAFRDYTFRTAITDWDGTWRNWMRKAKPDKRSEPVETFQQRAARERVAQMSPRLAAKAPGAQHDFEVIDGSTKLLA